MKLVPYIFLPFLLAVVLTFSNVTVAAPFAGKNTTKQVLKVKSNKQAAQKVQRQFGGKVLKTQRSNAQGKQGYKVKVIKKNGNVFSVWVDAKSGRLVKR